MKYTLKAKTHTLRGEIDLPASKSISNRILLIRALAQKPFPIENLSDAQDTVHMQSALDRNDRITDVGPAGTAMRFLTAYYAGRPGEKVLTGSERMQARPIGVLVDALRSLGAQITYLEHEGFPPLHIEGRRLRGGIVHVPGDISSQFISALMLIGPTLPEPLHIRLEGDPLSRPYIAMTSELMAQCGAQVSFVDREIIVQPGRYRSNAFRVEQDWSAAAFWMGFAALSRRSTLLLKGLEHTSVQGDRDACNLFARLGVVSTFNEQGLLIEKAATVEKPVHWNFRDHPDLVQPAAITAAALRIPMLLEGLDNLRLKETDRIAALQMELQRIGVPTEVDGFTLRLKGSAHAAPASAFDAHDDHRMVMSLCALVLVFPEIVIRDPLVVAKSYPGFWSQVQKFVDYRPGR